MEYSNFSNSNENIQIKVKGVPETCTTNTIRLCELSNFVHQLEFDAHKCWL